MTLVVTNAIFGTSAVTTGTLDKSQFNQYLPLLMMAVLGCLFMAGSFFASRLLAPRRPTDAKLAPYECGILPSKEPPQRFPVRFYMVALTFVILDVEVIFLFPYAVNAVQLGTFGVVEMVLFAIPVVVTLGFLIAIGTLEWGPAKSTKVEYSSSSAKSSIRRIPKQSGSLNKGIAGDGTSSSSSNPDGPTLKAANVVVGANSDSEGA